MYSFVIEMATEVNKAALYDITIPTERVVIGKVELVIVEPPPMKIHSYLT